MPLHSPALNRRETPRFRRISQTPHQLPVPLLRQTFLVDLTVRAAQIIFDRTGHGPSATPTLDKAPVDDSREDDNDAPRYVHVAPDV